MTAVPRYCVTPMIRAVIFDLDGVLVPTDEYHYRSWAETAAAWRIPFHRETYDRRMRGLARDDALAALLEATDREFSEDQRCRIAEAKNERFLARVARGGLRPAPGAVTLVHAIRSAGVKVGVGSSSRNAALVLGMTRLDRLVDVVVDGCDAPGKPQPDIFQRVAGRLDVAPNECVVVEDASDGIEAARRAGMAVVAIGPVERLGPIPRRVDTLAQLTLEMLLGSPLSP